MNGDQVTKPPATNFEVEEDTPKDLLKLLARNEKVHDMQYVQNLLPYGVLVHYDGPIDIGGNTCQELLAHGWFILGVQQSDRDDSFMYVAFGKTDEYEVSEYEYNDDGFVPEYYDEWVDALDEKYE